MKIHHIPDHIVFKYIPEHEPVKVVDVAKRVANTLPIAKTTSALNAATTPELGLIVFMDMIFEHKTGPMMVYVAAVVVRKGATFVLSKTKPDGVIHHAAEHIIKEVDAHNQEFERDIHAVRETVASETIKDDPRAL